MSIVRDFIDQSPCRFFEEPPIKRCLIRFIGKYGGGGSTPGLQFVTTNDSATITFSGDGTSGSPLTASVTFPTPINYTFENGLTFTGPSTVRWGGTLTQNTTIDGNQNRLVFDDLNQFNITVSDTTTVKSIGMDPNGSRSIYITDFDSSTNRSSNVNVTADRAIIVSNDLTSNDNKYLAVDPDIVYIYQTYPASPDLTHFSVNSNGDGLFRGNLTIQALPNALGLGTDPSGLVIATTPLNTSDFKGGQSVFTADGSTMEFEIVHNLGAIPSYFTLTTTEPIATNHLSRTITFPDDNTMKLTFSVAPNVGENANYVWIVYK